MAIHAHLIDHKRLCSGGHIRTELGPVQDCVASAIAELKWNDRLRLQTQRSSQTDPITIRRGPAPAPVVIACCVASDHTLIDGRFQIPRCGPMAGDEGRCSQGQLQKQFRGYEQTHPTHTRAFLNILSHGESSPASGGDQDICALRKLRSGWGMRMLMRPSSLQNAVRPPLAPFGFQG